MSAMQRVRPTKRGALDRTFAAYVHEIGRIRDVLAVVADNGGEFTITTVIRRRNVRVCARLYDVERRLFETRSGLHPDFRVVYAQGRPLDQVLSAPSSYPWSWVRNANKNPAPRSS